MNLMETFLPKGNPVEGYCRFFFTKLYLCQRFEHYATTDYRIQQLMEIFGYNLKNPNRKHKFLQNVERMNNLELNIPLSYLDAIQVNYDELELCVTADKWNYERYLLVPRYPKQAIVRVMAAVYLTYKFEENTPEEKAIETIQERIRTARKAMKHCINYPGLLSIWFEKTGEYHYSYYRPRLWYTKKMLMVHTQAGEGIGQTRVV